MATTKYKPTIYGVPGFKDIKIRIVTYTQDDDSQPTYTLEFTKLSDSDKLSYKIKEKNKKTKKETTVTKTKSYRDACDHYYYVFQYKTPTTLPDSYSSSKKNPQVANKWFTDKTGTTKTTTIQYTPPEYASAIRFRIKPVSATYTDSDGKTAKYFTGKYPKKSPKWITLAIDNISNNPEVPDSPTINVDYDNNSFTAYVESYDDYTGSITFDIANSSGSSVKQETISFISNRATMSTFKMETGEGYRVRCRANSNLNSEVSDWSQWSDIIESAPASITNKPVVRILNRDSIELSFDSIARISSPINYIIEYTTNEEYFDKSLNNIQRTSSDKNEIIMTGLGSGTEYFVRVKAVNDSAESLSWSPIESFVLGMEPYAPTVWSNLSTITDSTKPIFYWYHNSKDGSASRVSEIWYKINDETPVTVTVNNTTDTGDSWGYYKSETQSYTLNKDFADGTKITWKVRTKGIYTAGTNSGYGEWSPEKFVYVYKKPQLSSVVSRGPKGYPITLDVASLNTIVSIKNYAVSFKAKEDHILYSRDGSSRKVSSDELVYSKVYSTGSSSLSASYSINDVLLDPNQEYVIVVRAVSLSDVKAEIETSIPKASEADTIEPTVSELLEPSKIFLSPDDLTCSLTFKMDSVPDTIKVFRKDLDGRKTEITKKTSTTSLVTFKDMYPPVNSAEYIITSVDTSTGRISYYETPIESLKGIVKPDYVSGLGYVKDVTESIILEWEDNVLLLLYDIDADYSDGRSITTVSYEGRDDSVAYFGRTAALSMSWKVDVLKSDTDIFKKLIELNNYKDVVHVRDPRGYSFSGIASVSMNVQHNTYITPVTLTVTRSESRE